MRTTRWLATLLASLLATGLAPVRAANGVSDGEIRLGASVALTGPFGPQTAEYIAGSRMYFDVVNAKGGVLGRKISYQTLDDGFDVKRAVENSRRLLDQDKVFLIYNNTGTAGTAAILPLAADAKAVVFGPVTGAMALRQKFNRNLFHVRAGYADEAARIVRQLREIGVTRVATFHQDDPFGNALMSEVRTAAKAQQLKIEAETSFDPKKPDFAGVASAIAKAAPQALIMCTAGGNFTGVVKALRTTAARPSIYGFSVVSVDQTTRDLGPAAHGIVLAQIMPSLSNRANPVVSEYLGLVDGNGIDAASSFSRFEGYVHARVLVEGLRRAGRDLNTESFIHAMESAGEIAFGKFAARYSPQSHNGSSYVELAIIDGDGKLR